MGLFLIISCDIYLGTGCSRPKTTARAFTLKLQGARRPWRVRSEGHNRAVNSETQSRQGSLRSLYLHPTWNMRPMESSAKRGQDPVEPCPRWSQDPALNMSFYRSANVRLSPTETVGIDLSSCQGHSEARWKTHRVETFSRPPLEPFLFEAPLPTGARVFANTREPYGYLPAMTSV